MTILNRLNTILFSTFLALITGVFSSAFADSPTTRPSLWDELQMSRIQMNDEWVPATQPTVAQPTGIVARTKNLGSGAIDWTKNYAKSTVSSAKSSVEDLQASLNKQPKEMTVQEMLDFESKMSALESSLTSTLNNAQTPPTNEDRLNVAKELFGSYQQMNELGDLQSEIDKLETWSNRADKVKYTSAFVGGGFLLRSLKQWNLTSKSNLLGLGLSGGTWLATEAYQKLQIDAKIAENQKALDDLVNESRRSLILMGDLDDDLVKHGITSPGTSFPQIAEAIKRARVIDAEEKAKVLPTTQASR